MPEQDLKRAMPELGRGLQQLLDFDGDVESTFAQSFEVQYDYFGELRTVELKPGGSDIPVTNDNRIEYVRLMTDYHLNKSVQEQFSAFASGFLEVRLPFMCGVLIARGVQARVHLHLEYPRLLSTR